ncbi:SpoIVB peptidase S55 domain-containing protein [Isoptericola halotolerans]|uniref:Peptidase S55 domain-containing protein n=1 Tax=Isoptericola halotolerans TaxID=300560 RepID=A0ABX2A7W0_9MICO|nr:SpoIVB peptidase S55 domain-containing protein [Isoptericola halotolerans]NOV98869.1 hypothetical protein [Isoptericola halotolerans]
MTNIDARDDHTASSHPRAGGTTGAAGSSRPRASRGRRAVPLAASGAVGALLLSGLVAVGPPAAAAPASDCAVPFPVSQLTSGAPVSGLTVSKGTTPQEFTGEVLGVLADGIGPGLDMIVAELDSPAIDAAGGIWQGMSGSPVYAEDGRLIGAVAYGLAWGSSPVAGITPFESMDDYLGAAKAAPKVAVGPRLAGKIAAETDVTTSQASQGLRQLPMPMGVGGVDLGRARDAGRSFSGKALVGADSYRIGRSAGSAAAGVDTVVAGGNIGAVLTHGDVTFAGVGTVTSVCDKRVVAFGHPMSFSGKTRLGLAAADAVYVQKDPLGVPFKVANLGALGGTITDDRLAGIAGTFGAAPAAARITSKVTYDGRTRTGTTQVLYPPALGEATLYAGLANHDRVVDGWIPGSQTQAWTIKGTRSGSPFTLRYADRYRSAYDIGFDSAFDLAEVVFTLSSLSGVKVTGVTNDVKVSDSQRRYRVAKIQQRTGGRWVDVTGERVKVRAGSTLVLRTQLVGSDGTTKTFFRQEVKIPKRLKGERGTVAVVGGNAYKEDFSGLRSFDGIRNALRTNQRNDEVGMDVSIGDGKTALERTRTSDPLPRVVDGHKQVKIRVIK